MKQDFSILVVDDDSIIRNLMEKILKKDGFVVKQANDGYEALTLLEAEKIELVITDMKMPGMNGMDLLKNIKDKHPQISVIIITAYGDSYTVKDALIAGADEYVTKPFKSHEISLVVERTYWRIINNTYKEDNIIL